VKRTLLILACLLLGRGGVRADIGDPPDHIFLENTFNFIRVLDTFALTASERGLICLKYNSAIKQFEPVSRLGLPAEAYTIRVSSGMAAVATGVNVVYFIDISNLPVLTLSGEADLEVPFYDYALHNQSLYVANGFDGVWRYQLTDYSDPIFADSSLKGVHCIQLELRNDELLVLDDYNGILRYDVSADNLNSYRDCLYLPRRAASFELVDTTLYIPLTGSATVWRASTTVSPPVVTDTFTLRHLPQAIEVVDTFLVSMDMQYQTVELTNTRTRESAGVVVDTALPRFYEGDGHAYDGCTYVFMPSKSGGILALDPSRILIPPHVGQEAYTIPGPVTGLAFHADRLVTTGMHNPIQFYIPDSVDAPVLDTTAYGMTHVGAIAAADWACFFLLPEANFIYTLTLDGDSITILSSVTDVSAAVEDIKFVDKCPIDTIDALLAIAPSRVYLYAITPDHTIRYASSVSPSTGIQDAVIVDSFLIVSTNKAQLYAYKINSDYSTTFWWAIGSSRSLRHLVATTCVDTSATGFSSVICGFSDRAMYRIRVPRLAVGSVEYIQSLPIQVWKSAAFGVRMYTIGDDGIGVFDVSSGFPEFLESGSYGGRLIATDGDILVTSDGTAALVYDLEPVLGPPSPDSLLPSLAAKVANYPNPFNPVTTIQYVLPARAAARLTVVNLLGQTVSVLVDKYQEAGVFEVEWNGKDNRGERVASGVYFCRLSAAGHVTTHKMVLLK
jgi:hypothetical protein